MFLFPKSLLVIKTSGRDPGENSSGSWIEIAAKLRENRMDGQSVSRCTGMNSPEGGGLSFGNAIILDNMGANTVYCRSVFQVK